MLELSSQISIRTDSGNVFIQEVPSKDATLKHPYFEENPIYINKRIIASKEDVTLLLDEDIKYCLLIQTQSGNIRVKDFAGKIVNLRTNTGSISISNCIAKVLQGHCAGASINLENITAETARLTTTSGNINIKNIITKDVV